MEGLYKLPNGDYITLKDVREIAARGQFVCMDTKTPNGLIIHTIYGTIYAEASSISEAQTWRDELARAVDLVRAKA